MAESEQPTSIVENEAGQEMYPESIYLIQEGDEVKGGAEGTANKQATELAKRTQWLHTALMQFSPIIASLMAQVVVGDISQEYREVGSIIPSNMLNLSAGYATDNTYQLYLSALTTPYTADVFVKRNKAEGGQELIRKIGVALSGNRIALFDEPIPFDDTVEVEVVLADNNPSEFRVWVAEKGVRTRIWSRAMTYVPTM